MKSLTLFPQIVLDEIGTICRVSTTRDSETVSSRLEHEGLSFLTITLANFGKDLEKGLDLGFVADDHFAGFRRRGGLPQFLGGFLRLVFDPNSGRLLDVPSIEAIRCLRQFLLMWAKIEIPCSDARNHAAVVRYFECEQDVRLRDSLLSPDLKERFVRIGRMLWSGVFTAVDSDIAAVPSRVVPKHGPGSTADSLRGNEKWDQFEWTTRLETYFPHGEHLVSSWRHFDALDHVNILEPGHERPVEVLLVPKTLKTPRIIAREPTAMQYAQQGICLRLRAAIQDTYLESLVGWSDQTPNQRLARSGSRNGRLATLDLSEASDRVSNQHVRLLLANHPNLFGAVDACRSRKADVFGKVIRLAKFASMGSALCFDMEYIVFLTIVFVAIERELKRPLALRDVKSLKGRVRVYGDDIIVPVEFALPVSETLESFGLKVNSDKSFWSGKFRESCGKDYYDGHDITLVKVRQVFPSGRKDVPELVSTVSLRNQLYFAGYWGCAAWLDEELESLIPFPIVPDTSPVLGRHSFLDSYKLSRPLHRDLHCPVVQGYVVASESPISRLDGHGALLKCLTQLELSDDSTDTRFLPASSVKHLERSGRPHAVRIKLRWVPIT